MVERVDLTDAPALARIFSEHVFDGVVHLAAQAGVRHSLEFPEEYQRNNIDGTFVLLEAMRAAGVKRLVFASTSSVYGDDTPVPFVETVAADRPVSLYAASKRAGELLAYTYHIAYGFEVVCLRFFTVYGPWGRPDMAIYTFTSRIMAGESVTLFNFGDMRRDFTYVDDIVSGVVAALHIPAGYAVYNLGRGEAVSLHDFVTAIEDATGKVASIELAPIPLGDVTQTYADITAARRDLGYEPQTSVADGVAQYVAWYREYYGG